MFTVVVNRSISTASVLSEASLNERIASWYVDLVGGQGLNHIKASLRKLCQLKNPSTDPDHWKVTVSLLTLV